MDKNVKNGSINKPLVSVESEKVELNGETEKDNETESLLPSRRGGLSKKSGKPRLKVQWNDKMGTSLQRYWNSNQVMIVTLMMKIQIRVPVP
ncbi:hypothetical protein LOK49_LG06G02607 [Camellia lanceoleosa]|uniref:Uncharacterized protein n=1 Tax=Camellia lanceoleosa TaxID=1840588 RepID=A0ACC0H8V0_9ERIC|nr:hypothetical protein LOK49_LG06G02607 [Camellia lanceoleosa]